MNKNYPKIRFSEFEKAFEENGGEQNSENPYAWEQRKLGDVAEIIGGGTPSTSVKEYWNGDIDWYSPVEIGEQIYVNGSQKKITEFGLQKSSAKILPVDTVLFTSRAGIGNTAILEKKGCTNQGFQSIVPKKKELDTYFIFSRTHELKRYGEINGAGSTFVEVSGKQMLKMSLMIPKIEEQNKIGKLFSTLDHTITLHQRKLKTLEKMKKSCLQKLFPKNGEQNPEIRFTEFKKLFEENGGEQNSENPYAWEQRKLGELGYTFTGLSGKTKKDFGHGDAKFVTYMNVFSNPITKLEMTENVEIDDRQNSIAFGDVFFTTSSETSDEVGMSSVWLGNGENIYLNSFCFGYRPTAKIFPYYLAFMLRSPSVRKKFMLLAQGISRYNISKTKVMDMKVSIPEFVEQQRVGKFFYELDHTITLHQRKLKALQDMKKSLLQKMFI